MTYAFELVVRKKDGRYSAGAANEMPLSQGWKQVISFGKWFGIQTDYRPYNNALMRAIDFAKRKNEEAEQKEEETAEIKFRESVE